MKTTADVIVVGAGPCGSFAALNMAKHGANVEVLEEHKEIGVPSHCAGHLSVTGLENLGLHSLPTEIVENTFFGATFYSPKGRDFAIRFSKPITCVINRALFDKYIAKMTEDAGVEYQLNSRVESLIIEDGFVKGAVVKQNGRSEQRFLAKIVVDAEGISSRILTRTGMAGLNRLKLVNGVEAEVENVKDVKMDMVEVFLGKNYAPGFYAWLIPQDDGKAKVGLATNTGNPKEFLQRLMLKHPVASKKLCNSKILKINYHPITLGGLIPKIYSNGFLAVGDVASQVKPTTGGGVIFGLTCAKVAAEVVVEALRENDFSADFLGAYQKRCEEILGFDLKVMLRVRRILDALSDEKIEQAIGICAKLNLGKPIQNIEEIDFQGRSFLHLLRSPRMIVALTYLFFLFLSPNC